MMASMSDSLTSSMILGEAMSHQDSNIQNNSCFMSLIIGNKVLWEKNTGHPNYVISDRLILREGL